MSEAAFVRSGAPAWITDTVAAIRPANRAAGTAAQAELDRKTKPRASLGGLEALAVRIAAIRDDPVPGALPAAVVVAAADHGVAAEGVSAYPQEVTGQMLRNFAAGGAAVCVLARQAAARLVVVDVGVRSPVDDPAIVSRRVSAGTANATRGPAMTRAEAEHAIAAGLGLVDDLVEQGIGLIGLGEMGIANTTAASAVCAALLGAPPAAVCGRGTGIDDTRLARKVAVVERMLAANRLDPGDPVGVLAAVGGLEIGALVGIALRAAARRVPVVIDGFISATAALVAARLAPDCVDAMVAAHRSPEPGHAFILRELSLDPLLDLDLRLGEGSGAALALPVIGAALAILSEMATFDDAGVSDTGA